MTKVVIQKIILINIILIIIIDIITIIIFLTNKMEKYKEHNNTLINFKTAAKTYFVETQIINLRKQIFIKISKNNKKIKSVKLMIIKKKGSQLILSKLMKVGK